MVTSSSRGAGFASDSGSVSQSGDERVHTRQLSHDGSILIHQSRSLKDCGWKLAFPLLFLLLETVV